MEFWKYLVSFLVFQKYGADGICEVTDTSYGGYKIWCTSTDEIELFSFYEESGYHKNWIEIKLENSRFEYLENIIPNERSPELFLSITNSNVTTIDDDCLKDKSFNTLDLSYNLIQNLNFLESLYVNEILNLSHNKIQFINGIYFRRLNAQYLDLSFNSIISVHEFYSFFFQYGAKLDRLQAIDLSYNNLEEILVSDFLHVPNLQCLNVSHNKLMFLDSSFQVNTLIAKNNDLRSFDFSNFKGNRLDVSYNVINEINISRNEEYLYLNVKNNKIEKLTTNTLKVAEIDLAYNFISDISNLSFYSNKPDQKNVSLNFNGLTKIDLSIFDNLMNISILNLSSNPLEYIYRRNIYFTTSYIVIDTLDLSYCLLQNLDQNIFSHLSINRLDLSHNSLIKLPENILHNSCLLELDIGFNSITEFHISNDLCIKKLSLAGMISQRNGEPSNVINSEIKQLDVAPSNQLNLSNTSVSNSLSKSPSNHTTSETLSLTENFISEPDPVVYQYNLYIKDLAITINDKINKRNFEKLVSLQKLQFIDSSISNLTKGCFFGLSHLRELHFINSKTLNVEPGAFIGLDRLEYLDTFSLFGSVEVLRSNLFEGLTNLKFLNLSGRGIQKIETKAFSGLMNLKVLDLSENRLKTLKIGVFNDITNLEEMYLNNNYFKEILPIGVFSNLKSLTHLDLSHCQMEHLNESLLFPLKKLNVLNLNYNFLKFRKYPEENNSNIFNPKSFPELKYVGIGHNSWICQFLLVILEELRLNQVDYLELSDLQFETKNIEGIQCN